MIDLTKYPDPDPSPIFVFPVLWIGMVLLFKQWLVECVGVKKGFKFSELTTQYKIMTIVSSILWVLIFVAMAYFTKQQFS